MLLPIFVQVQRIFEIFSFGGKGKPLLNDSSGGFCCVSYVSLRVLLCPPTFLLSASVGWNSCLSFEGATEFVTSLFSFQLYTVVYVPPL